MIWLLLLLWRMTAGVWVWVAVQVLHSARGYVALHLAFAVAADVDVMGVLLMLYVVYVVFAAMYWWRQGGGGCGAHEGPLLLLPPAVCLCVCVVGCTCIVCVWLDVHVHSVCVVGCTCTVCITSSPHTYTPGINPPTHHPRVPQQVSSPPPPAPSPLVPAPPTAPCECPPPTHPHWWCQCMQLCGWGGSIYNEQHDGERGGRWCCM